MAKPNQERGLLILSRYSPPTFGRKNPGAQMPLAPASRCRAPTSLRHRALHPGPALELAEAAACLAQLAAVWAGRRVNNTPSMGKHREHQVQTSPPRPRDLSGSAAPAFTPLWNVGLPVSSRTPRFLTPKRLHLPLSSARLCSCPQHCPSEPGRAVPPLQP